MTTVEDKLTVAQSSAKSSTAAIWEQLPPDILRTLNQVAGQVSGHFGRYSDADDLAQFGWLWITEHPWRIRTWWYKNPQGDDKFSYHNFRRDVAVRLNKVAKHERALALGYNPDDDYNYAGAVVKRYLRFVWHSDALAVMQDVNEKSFTKVDPSRGGNAAVLAMDVRAAYELVVDPGTIADRICFGVHALGLTVAQVGEQLGLVENRVTHLYASVIKELAYELNGGDSLGPGHTLRDGPGSKRMMRYNRLVEQVGD